MLYKLLESEHQQLSKLFPSSPGSPELGGGDVLGGVLLGDELVIIDAK